MLAAASWLPAHASGARAATARAAAPHATDLAREALSPPAVRPVAPAGPVQAVSGFLWSLGSAVAGQTGPGPTVGQTPATGASPTTGAPGESFARAYAYLTPAGRAALPFAAFARQWAGVHSLDLLAALPAGPPEGEPRLERVFVEVRTLGLACGEPSRVCLSFAAGFYTTEPTSTGWRVRGGSLSPERFGLDRPPVGATPEAVAAAAARALAARLGRPGAGATPQVQVSRGAGYQATAVVHLGAEHYDVRLYHLADGAWTVVRLAR